MGASHCVSHFRPFNKIDIFYLNRAAFQLSPWLAQPVTVLHDPEMAVTDVVAHFVTVGGTSQRRIAQGGGRVLPEP